MCKYCRMEENGDVVNNKFLINKNAFFDDELTHEQDGIKMSVKVKEPIRVYAEVYAPTKTLEFEAIYQDETTSVFDFNVKVNYCPMCGRKL